MAGAPCTVLRP